MPDIHFELNEENLRFVEEIGRHMPGGFFVYKAEEPTELLYANEAVFTIFGCRDEAEFRDLTGYTFRGMLHPEDYPAVSDSIVKQIAGSADSMDYVEYRIVRKDGAVRWVDDYGHFTETLTYGGVYYVFISDITEKREQMQSDLAIRQAVIEVLSESYHTVWIITDVENEYFSLYRGDTKGASAHAAPIRDALDRMKYSDAKDRYIRSTVAEEDRERLQRELALPELVRRLEEKPRFSVNYLRRMEDGSKRCYRIEFARISMPGGKLGIVCGFRDVDDEYREAQQRQRELEERLALQERLLEEEKQRARQRRLITALSSDYWSVYYVDLDRDEGICFQESGEEDDYRVGQRFPYLSAITEYAHTFVTEAYREEFLRFVQPDAVRAGLRKGRVISHRYLIRKNGKELFVMIRFAGVRHPEDRADHLVHAVGLSFSNVDAETRSTLEQSQALRDALAVAEEANKAKTAFLSNMSHEIRTPMNAIIGLNSIALSDPEVSGRTREYLEKIGGSAQHLLNIINDILDMSRIESGRMTLRHEEFSFSRALEQVNTIISGQCRDKGLRYDCRTEGRVDACYIGDDMKLRQILINVLGNAVKFTPEGGSVTFLIREQARYDGMATLRFTIADTGIGMSPEFLPHIYDAFAQEDSSSTSKYGSSGLGLAITKNLVEMMNGEIRAESRKGEGTTFTVTLTLQEAEHGGEGPDASDLQPGELCVLVIDDDPVACEHAQLVLGQLGIACDAAGSGPEAIGMVKLRHARQTPYDLILVDWRMPEMDGLETTRQIRGIIGDDSAIIILTSYNWDDVVDEAREAGVDSFVPKPLFAATVLDEFREACRRRNAASHPAKAELRGRRILLAEDVSVNAEIMVMVLEMREMKVDVAENGRIAADAFAASPPGYYDAILMDMRMPVMDGLEATVTIRAMDRPDAKTIPIIALTANAFDEDVQRSMQAGLNAHLSKPVEPDALCATLENLIRDR